MTADVLGIGITGKTLTDLEKTILRNESPYAVVLFGRNVDTVEQLRDLVAEVKSIAPRPPLFMIDEEGGRVDRLRHILPGLPSVEAFGEGEEPERMAEWAGKVIGMALRYFDIEINLAPVVDVRGTETAPKGLERRTFGADPQTVSTLAGAFMRGHHGAGVATCIKHWPGIGEGSADPHYGATVIDISLEDLIRRHLPPFHRLAREAGAVMIGHGTYPRIAEDPDLPATLSWELTSKLLRGMIEFEGAAISDDMEMHAVSDLGSYEDIAERALMAGNDVILFCSHVERVVDIRRHLIARSSEDAEVGKRFEEAARRCEVYRAHCERLRSAAPPPASFDEVLDEAERFVTELERTRPHREVIVPDHERRKNSRSPGKGRTGREEWT